MEKVEMYKAGDGNLFDSERECAAYEKKRAIISKIEEELHLRDVDPEDLYDWIKNNIRLFKS